MKRLIAVIALLCASAFGQAAGTGVQIPIGGAPDPPSGSALPATCSPSGSPKVFFKTTAPIGLQQCLSANTWTAIGGGGSVTSVSGTTNQITSTGGATPVLALASPLTTPGAATITGALTHTGIHTFNGSSSGSLTLDPGTTATGLTDSGAFTEKGVFSMNGSASSAVNFTPASNAANLVVSTGNGTTNGIEISGVYLQVASNGFFAFGSATGLPIGADTAFSRPAAKVIYAGDGSATTNRTAVVQTGNTVFVAGDFTTAANTSLQTITGLSWTVPALANNYSFTCDLIYSQATAAAAVAFGIQAATNTPTAINALGVEGTSLTASTSGTLRGLATTTATNIVSATPSAAGAIGTAADMFTVHLAGTIENPASANTINIMVSTATGADAVTVYRGSTCQITP